MSGQLIVPAWYAPASLSLLLTLMAPAAFWLGAVIQPVTNYRTLAGAMMILIVVGLVHTFSRRELYGRAEAADATLDAAAHAAGEQYAILARNIERREHERLLHDTVLNTLTALARTGNGDAGEVVGRCRHDVALMEYVLSDPGGADQGAGRLYGGLLGGIEAVAAEMRARGLVVHIEVTDGIPARAGVCSENGSRAGPGGGALAVPVPVAAAIAHAVREALANVAAHAGTGEAWVKVNLAVPGEEGAASGRFLVTVRDVGAGFDATRLDPARLGLRRSITERVADWGGRASIGSAPGDGTVVCLCWPAAAHPGQVAVGGTAGQGGLPW